MTFHGTNRLIHTTRKRTASYNNTDNNTPNNYNLDTTPIAIMSTSGGGGTYRGSTSSIIDGIPPSSSYAIFRTNDND